MLVELKSITDTNREECCSLQVKEQQKDFICENANSLHDAVENEEVARPFAICADGNMVGFAMFAFDEGYENPNDRYWLWRFMIDEKQQGKGYGQAALKEIIAYFLRNGATHIKLSTKEGNKGALALYHKFGFSETGEMNDQEIVLKKEL